jgi:hypothetical protein
VPPPRPTTNSVPSTATRWWPPSWLTGIAIVIGVGAFAAVAVGGNPDERMHRLV